MCPRIRSGNVLTIPAMQSPNLEIPNSEAETILVNLKHFIGNIIMDINKPIVNYYLNIHREIDPLQYY